MNDAISQLEELSEFKCKCDEINSKCRACEAAETINKIYKMAQDKLEELSTYSGERT